MRNAPEFVPVYDDDSGKSAVLKLCFDGSCYHPYAEVQDAGTARDLAWRLNLSDDQEGDDG